MRILKARIYELAEKKQREGRAELTGEKKEIAFGSQIRSYTFHPYQLIKDHRTGLEIGNVEAVMDGDLDGLIRAYLLWTRGREAQRRAGEGPRAQTTQSPPGPKTVVASAGRGRCCS